MGGQDENVSDIPVIVTQSQNVEGLPADSVHDDEGRVDLNVSSPVEEVVVAVLEVLGQGRPNVDPIGAGVEEEEIPDVSPSNEQEVVIRTEVICLDSEDEWN